MTELDRYRDAGSPRNTGKSTLTILLHYSFSGILERNLSITDQHPWDCTKYPIVTREVDSIVLRN